ncbi:hypothetical protein JOD07_003009 [Defluviitalea raffinosedens]|nr:hypothetical protein [Defluviitalea raffinosedens]
MVTNAKFYTCYYTCIEPYIRLKAAMGDFIAYLAVK